MSDELYFLPLIAQALHRSDPRSAIRESFDRIRTMGQDRCHALGYQQFVRFMSAVYESLWRHAPEGPHDAFLAEPEQATSIVLVLARNNVPVTTCVFSQGFGTQSVGGISPGPYQLSMNTGLVLWEGTLTKEDLLWGKAFPKLDLPMAARTGDSMRRQTQEIHLLDGTLRIRVYPDLETGTIEIALRAQETRQ